MYVLKDDIIFIITNFLNFNDILNFSILDKYYYKLFDDIYYKNLSIKYYTEKFWIYARNRPIKLSKPLKSYKKEIIRIEYFQKRLDNLNNDRWTCKDFYNYWNHENKWWYSLYY